MRHRTGRVAYHRRTLGDHCIVHPPHREQAESKPGRRIHRTAIPGERHAERLGSLIMAGLPVQTIAEICPRRDMVRRDRDRRARQRLRLPPVAIVIAQSGKIGGSVGLTGIEPHGGAEGLGGGLPVSPQIGGNALGQTQPCQGGTNPRVVRATRGCGQQMRFRFSDRTSGQRTAPFRWWARTLEIDVKMMVDMEVAMAIFRPRSSGMLRAASTMVRKGTMIMPPPMPSNPAMKPVNKPNTASSKITRGSSIMVCVGCVGGAEMKGK